MQVTDITSAGDGGVATGAADGGTASAGDVNSGGNVCNAMSLGNTSGNVPVDPQVYGGECLDTPVLGIRVDGGSTIADASGGNFNLAFFS